MKDNNNELFPIVDEKGSTIGCATRGECHNGSKFLHPVVHLHIFNHKGELFLQKRPEWKDIQPGKWDTAVGGHVDYGEEIIEALRREAVEEVGLKSFESYFLSSYIFESNREREYVNVFKTIVEEEDLLPSEELDGGKFWSIEAIASAYGKGILTPNLEKELIRLNIIPTSDETNN